MGAWFERNVSGRTARAIAGGGERDRFRMRTATGGSRASRDNSAITHDHAANGRIGRR